PATSPPRTFSICFEGRVLKPASTSTRSSPHRGGSAASSARTSPGCWRVRATTLCRMPKRAGTHKVAVIQHPPVTLDRRKTLERDGEFSRGTLYTTAVLIGSDGAVLNRHRKLVPTNPERMVWGMGDASGLRVSDTPMGRVGGLICWENYMPLVRFALYAQGCEIYIAPTWDEGETWISTMRHIAAEGRCWVLGKGCAMRGKDIPKDFPQRTKLFPDLLSWYNPGDSVIVNPRGVLVAGPLHEQHGILYADCDPAVASAAKRTLDVAGHYGRPDIFHLEVKREALAPIDFA